MTLDEVIKRYINNAEYERTHGNLQGCLEFKQLAEWLKDYKRLLEQDLSGDTISRQAVLDLCDKSTKYDIPFEYYEGKKHIRGWDIGRIINMNKLIELPSVKPQEPTGHWEEVGEEYIQAYDLNGIPSCGDERICSECGFETVFIGEHCSQYKFCPNCGAKMIDPQERSDKE